MRLLGIDFGHKRIGIALSDTVGDFAYPHSVLINSQHVTAKIQKICVDEGVEKIIIGDSRDYKGVENPIMQEVHVFKKALEEASGLPVIFELEMLSSAEAERIQGKRPSLDASAAAIILRSYISRVNSGKSF